MAKLTKDQKELMELCIECDGVEVPKVWWDDASILKNLGYVTISGAHGPERNFKRITPVTKPVYKG